jgi:hypothetical protein
LICYAKNFCHVFLMSVDAFDLYGINDINDLYYLNDINHLYRINRLYCFCFDENQMTFCVQPRNR